MRVLAEGCRFCCSEVDPSGPRENEDHIAIRFGDGVNYEVYLDGEKAYNVTEAWAGHPGRVIEVVRAPESGAIRRCPCAHGELHITDSGHFFEVKECVLRLAEYDSVTVEQPDRDPRAQAPQADQDQQEPIR